MEAIRLRKLNPFFRNIFGRKVYKVGLWGGFTCPNRDGTLSEEGCSFCNPLSSRPATCSSGRSIEEQYTKGSKYISRRFKVSAFLPYFQDYTTTYGDIGQLMDKYRRAASFPGAVGLALCTRPDCIPEPLLKGLEELSRERFLWVELGVQTFDDELLKDMNRCHGAEDTAEAFRRLHEKKILSAAHMILGYPGSSGDTVKNDAGRIRELGVAAIKLQNLHVVKDTPMAARFRKDGFQLQSVEDYMEDVIQFLEHTHPDTVILRLTGDAPARMTVAPEWSLDKMKLLDGIKNEMARRGTWQGKSLGYCRKELRKPSGLSKRFRITADTIADDPPAS